MFSVIVLCGAQGKIINLPWTFSAIFRDIGSMLPVLAWHDFKVLMSIYSGSTLSWTVERGQFCFPAFII